MDSLFLSERILINNENCKKIVSGGIVVNIEDGRIKNIFTSQQEINSWIFLAHGGEVIFPREFSELFVRARENFYSAFSCLCLSQVYDFGNKVIMPGVIDANVNVCSGTDLEDFTTATKAAAAGGVTTIVDNPMLV